MTFQVSKAKIKRVFYNQNHKRMLESLYIKNFVLIDQLELDFHQQMSVFTGETGAGKSILLGALSLSLGARGDGQVVGPFSADCEIIATFNTSNNQSAQLWLKQNDWDNDANDNNHEVILRRQINGQGRSKLWINGRPTPASQVRELGQTLVQIHGQHDQIKLLNSNNQKRIVDVHGQHSELLSATATVANEVKSIEQQRQDLVAAGSMSQEQLQLIQYQYDELEQLALQKGEYESLHQQLSVATHAQDLIGTTEQSLLDLQDGEHNAQHLLSHTQLQLSQAQGMDFKDIEQMLEEAAINITEAYNELKARQENIENDPEQLSHIEARLDAIALVSRKQKIMPELLYDYHQELKETLTQHAHLSENQVKLDQAFEKALNNYRQQALKLSTARQKTAATLAKQISQVIQDLGLPDAQLRIDIEHDDDKTPQKDGNDHVTFMIATNKGQSYQPLNKTASGGELSRISLAIEVCSQKKDNAQSFVFDEVDTGIGGATAEKVGAIMQQLSQNNQVFAVTHLAQVAGHAHDHLLISKSSQGEHTTSRVDHLNEQQRIEELARMTGGEVITEATLAQAREFLKN